MREPDALHVTVKTTPIRPGTWTKLAELLLGNETKEKPTSVASTVGCLDEEVRRHDDERPTA